MDNKRKATDDAQVYTKTLETLAPKTFLHFDDAFRDVPVAFRERVAAFVVFIYACDRLKGSPKRARTPDGPA